MPEQDYSNQRKRPAEPDGSPEESARVAAGWVGSDSGRGGLSSAEAQPPGLRCYGGEKLLELSAGRVGKTQAETMLRHITSCDSCGPALRAATEALEGDATAAEEELLASLKSQTPEWQAKMAERIVGDSNITAIRAKAPVGSGSPPWGLRVAAAVVLAACIASLMVWLQGRRSPELLLARAYTAFRPFEYRLPDDGYAGAVKTERSASAARLEAPPELLEAEARIARGAASKSADARWWSWRCRAELMRGDYESAKDSAQRAVELAPEDGGYKVDLAIAYALRAQTEGRDVDYGPAMELLLEAQKLEPENLRVVFNLALVFEAMYVVREAATAWERYLELDPSSPYAREAREHLERLRDTRGSSPPAKDPESFLVAVADGNAREPEYYYMAALTDWLIERGEKPAAEEALSKLSQLAAGQHKDTWFRDFLVRRSEAERALAEAVRWNEEGRYSAALDASSAAAAAYRAAGSPAGELRALLAQAYTRQRSLDAGECLELIRKIQRAAEANGYRWIAIQGKTIGGICAYQQGRVGPALATLDEAHREARDAAYADLALRSQAMAGALHRSVGNHFEVWRVARSGLAEYWQRDHGPHRANQFYLDLAFSAEGMDLRLSAFHLRKAGIEEAKRTPDRLQEARGRVDLAAKALRAGYEREASRELELARVLYGQLAQDSVLATYWNDAVLELAEALVALERHQEALGQLNDMRGRWEPAPSLEQELRFRQAAAQAYLQAGNEDLARTEFAALVATLERRAGSLNGSAVDDHAMAGSTPAYRGLVELMLVDGQGPEVAFQLWDNHRSSGFRRGLDGSDLDRASLHGETILSYAMLPRGPYLWIITPEGVLGKRLQFHADELRRTVKRFASECADLRSHPRALRRDARQIYDWLLAPAAPYLKAGETLVIVPDEAIGAVPFAALLDERGEWLGTRYPITVAPAARLYAAARDRRPLGRSDKAFVVAEPAQGSGGGPRLPALHLAREEGRMVTGKFSGAHLVEGSAATLSAVRRGFHGARLFHFAGHGLVSGGHGALILTPEAGSGGHGRLTTGVVRGLDLSECRLAMLAACSTGVGEAAGPANPESLVRALLRAGAGGVVATRWNVSDGVSLPLVEWFYDSLLEGSAPSRALFEAARALAKSSETAHPYYWASYQLYGG